MTKKMKILATTLAVILVALASVQAGTVALENYDFYVYASGNAGPIPAVTDPEDTAGIALNWVIAVYQDGGNGTIDLFGSGDDTFLLSRQGSAWADNGYFSTDFTTDGGVGMFIRIFNASDFLNDSSIGSATEYVNLDGGIKSIPAFALPTDTYDWDPGGTAADGSDWLPIPEPATMSLFGLGLVVLALRKRLSK